MADGLASRGSNDSLGVVAAQRVDELLFAGSSVEGCPGSRGI